MSSRLEPTSGTRSWACTSADPDGAPLGTVAEVFRAGETEVYAIAQPDGGELLIPALRSVVRSIDLAVGLMVVDYAAEEVR